MPVSWIFTDRKGGASAPPFSSFNLGSHVGDDPTAVASNRRLLGERIDADSVVWMDQVHSARVQLVDSEQSAPLPATDGLVTARPGLALAVLVADCVPVLAFDEAAGVIGVAHAGRVGAASGVVSNLLAAMVERGAAVNRVTALLGPSICGRCYEVPPAMRVEVARDLPGSEAQTRWGTPALDLPAGLGRQLRAAGVAQVQSSPRCTLEDAALFSHRREAPTGRQAGVIWLRP